MLIYEPHYFAESEFRGWSEKMSPCLLIRLDQFRALWSNPVIISPAPGSLGRYLGAGDTSQHNYNKWGEVRAVDFMPMLETGQPGEYRGADKNELKTAVDIAFQVGFAGVGAYPYWKPYPGLHGDVRQAKRAKWVGLHNTNGKQYYTGMGAYFDAA